MTSAHLSPGLFSCLRSSSYQTRLHHPSPWMFSHHHKLRSTGQPVAQEPAWSCLIPSLHSDDTFPVRKGQSPLAHLAHTSHPIPYAPQFFCMFIVNPPIPLLHLSLSYGIATFPTTHCLTHRCQDIFQTLQKKKKVLGNFCWQWNKD